MSKLLYKKNKEKEMSLLKFLDKSGKEDDVQNFFGSQFENFFPKLQLFSFGENKETKYRYKEGENKGEFDAISWYPEKNTFVIFEYKVSKDKLLDQIYKYLGAIRGKIKNDLIEILNKKFPNTSKGWWSISDIDWEALKIVALSTDFYDWQNSSIVPDDRIVWIKLEWYKENDNDDVIILEGEDQDFLFLEELSGEVLTVPSSATSQDKKEVRGESKPTSLLQLLEKIKPNENIKKWSEELHEIIVREYYLVPKTYYYEGSGWKGIDWLQKDNIKDFSLFWVNISKKVFRVYFPNRSLDNYLRELLRKNKLQEKPTVFYWVVEDKEDFSKSLSILREFLNKKGVKTN